MAEDDIINPLATARFQSYEDWMGVAVSIALGSPRWMPGIEKIRGLMPEGFKDLEPQFAFRLRYEEHVEARAAAIHADLVRISRRYPGQRLVLMCWEDLTKPGEWCHREMAADFLRGKGLQIDEITPNMRLTATTSQRPPAPKPPEPEGLF